MRKLFVIGLLLFAGCGGSDDPKTPAAASATPTAAEAEHELDGYSQGVKDYYGGAHEHADDQTGNVEAEYHQPPKPAEAGLGETIELTGTQIGVRFRVTVTDVEPVDDDLLAVHLEMVSTGITIYEGPMEHATITYPGQEPTPVDVDARASCSNGFDGILRIDVARRRSGCLLFPASGDELPERFQLALEIVPVEAGGIWNLR
jgi:hypothetical protein